MQDPDSLEFDEFYLMAPPGVELFLGTMNLGGMRQEEYDKAIANIHVPLGLLAAHKPDAIVQAGVPPIVMRGWGCEDELRARVATLEAELRATGGEPAITLNPQTHYYSDPPTETNESSIRTFWNGQLYTVLGRADPTGG